MKADEIFDTLILLILVTAFLAIGVNAAIKEKNRTVGYSTQYVDDKNTKTSDVDSFILYGLGEGTYTFSEVVLAFQIQSQYMPQPRKLSVGYVTKAGKEVYMEPVDILANFDAYKDIYTGRVEKFAQKIKAEYGEDLNDMLFTLEIDNGAKLEDSKDDFYLFKYKSKAA